MDCDGCFLEVGRFGIDGSLSISGRLVCDLVFEGRLEIEGLGGIVGSSAADNTGRDLLCSSSWIELESSKITNGVSSASAVSVDCLFGRWGISGV